MPDETTAGATAGAAASGAGARPIAAPEAELPAAAPHAAIADEIEAVFATRIRGSRLSTDTEMLNLVRAAFDEVTAIVARHHAKLAADL